MPVIAGQLLAWKAMLLPATRGREPLRRHSHRLAGRPKEKLWFAPTILFPGLSSEKEFQIKMHYDDERPRTLSWPSCVACPARGSPAQESRGVLRLRAAAFRSEHGPEGWTLERPIGRCTLVFGWPRKPDLIFTPYGHRAVTFSTSYHTRGVAHSWVHWGSGLLRTRMGHTLLAPIPPTWCFSAMRRLDRAQGPNVGSGHSHNRLRWLSNPSLGAGGRRAFPSRADLRARRLGWWVWSRCETRQVFQRVWGWVWRLD